MNKITNERISKAARRYLEAKDYTVLDEFERDGLPYIAADDCGEVVIARLSFGLEQVPEPWCDRGGFEDVAAWYLREHDVVDLPVRGDSIDLMVLGRDRALLRHTVNCTGGFCGA